MIFCGCLKSNKLEAFNLTLLNIFYNNYHTHLQRVAHPAKSPEGRTAQRKLDTTEERCSHCLDWEISRCHRLIAKRHQSSCSDRILPHTHCAFFSLRGLWRTKSNLISLGYKWTCRQRMGVVRKHMGFNCLINGCSS